MCVLCVFVCTCSCTSVGSLVLSVSLLQCISVTVVQNVSHWVQTIPGFVCVSCCHAVYCTEWALGSEACENPTLAHLETVTFVLVCVRACILTHSHCLCVYIHVCVGRKLWANEDTPH